MQSSIHKDTITFRSLSICVQDEFSSRLRCRFLIILYLVKVMRVRMGTQYTPPNQHLLDLLV